MLTALPVAVAAFVLVWLFVPSHVSESIAPVDHLGGLLSELGLGFLVVGAGVTFVMTASRRALTSSTPVRRAGMASATSDLQSDLGGAVMQALLGAALAAGFAAAFASRITASPEAAEER